MDNNQDLKKLFNDPRIPEVDLTGKVMRKIHIQPKERGRFFMKYKVGLIAIVGMMLMASTGYAAVQFHSLYNKEGDVVFESKSTTELEVHESKEEREHFKAFYEIKENVLKNGEAALFYVVANNPNHQTDLGTKTTVYEDIISLRAQITDKSINIEDKVNGNYTFQKAEVLFKNAHEVNPSSPEEQITMANMLRQQAEDSNKGYAMMPVELTDQVSLLFVTYQNDEDKIEVMIKNLSDVSNPTAYIDEGVEFIQEKVHVKGVEMLLTEFGPSHASEITWIYESPDKEQIFSYTVMVNMDNVSNETLIQIAESLLQ